MKHISIILFVVAFSMMAQVDGFSRLAGSRGLPGSFEQYAMSKPPSSPMAIDPMRIPEITWMAVDIYHGDRQEIRPVAGTQITARFTLDGRLAGSAGCNRYRALYRIDGGNMTIWSPVTTRRVCREEGVMAQEAAFLGILPRVVNYTLTGRVLELWAEGGLLVARFVLSPGKYPPSPIIRIR
jgi:heat shock protein HslJ